MYKANFEKMSLKIPPLKHVDPDAFDLIQKEGVDVLFIAESDEDWRILLSNLLPYQDNSVWIATKGTLTYFVGRNGSEIAVLAKIPGYSGNYNSIGGANITKLEAERYWKPRRTQTLTESGLPLK